MKTIDTMTGTLKRIIVLVTGIILLCSCSRIKEAPDPVLPQLQEYNVLMISLDTLRKDRLGAYGHPQSISPFLDSMARRSVVFEDVSSQSASTWTSHRSIFTSKYVHAHTADTPAPEATLAGRFASAGYTTAAFVDGGKMHKRYGHSPGFETYDDDGGRFVSIVPKAVEWLRQHRSRAVMKPFFLFLHTYDIHAPYNPEDSDDRVFLGNDSVPDFYRTESPIYFNTLNLSQGEMNRLSMLYNGGVRSCDRWLARLFGLLKTEGMLDRTIVVFVSDHGESLGERAHLGHHEMYYVQVAVPLMMVIPEFGQRVVKGTVENLDIMPTLLDLVSIPGGSDLDGISQRTAIETGEVSDPLRFHLAEHSRRTIFRDMDWKYIVGETEAVDELYNLASDPAEETNLLSGNESKGLELMDSLMALTGQDSAGVRQPAAKPLHVEIFTKKDQKLKNQLQVLGYLEKSR